VNVAQILAQIVSAQKVGHVAIFGNLADFPFVELVGTLGRRTGKLEVWDLPSNNRLELHLKEAVLQGLIVNDQLVTNVLRVRDHLIELSLASNGNFEFSKLPGEGLQGKLNLPIQALLLKVTSTVNELSVYKDKFPAPQTRFKLAGSQELSANDAELSEFVRRARPSLERGVSALEIAERLGLKLEQVQLFLYKLRSAGYVAPARQREPARPPMPFSSMQPHEVGGARKSLLSRLLGALRLR
jgi:hypothetical protein